MSDNAPTPELTAALGKEEARFSFKSARQQPLINSILLIAVAVLFAGIGVYVFVYLDKAGFSLVFAGAGLLVLVAGIYTLVSPGYSYILTDSRILQGTHKGVNTIGYDECTNNISVSGKREEGTLKLTLRTGHYKESGSGTGGSSSGIVMTRSQKVWVPDVIYFVEIPRPYEVQAFIAERVTNPGVPTEKKTSMQEEDKVETPQEDTKENSVLPEETAILEKKE